MSLIKRIQPTSDETPPWEGMEFAYAVESDKLSEELKRTYPKCFTHRERKHMAAIDFLMGELHGMQTRQSTAAATENGLIGDGRSRRGSPTSSLSPSSTTHEPVFVEEHLQQVPTKTPATPAPLMPSTTSAQQFVFSAVDGRPLQPKTKRPMTRAEKIEYKKTRQRGACSPCRRQKAKCTHMVDDCAESLKMGGISRGTKR